MLKTSLDNSKNIDKPKIIIISGATASGKSAIAQKLANEFNGAIINADALQIYRDLPILSAQPSQANKAQIDHFLYGIFAPHQKISVGIWLELVKEAIDKILMAKKIPLVVGGSGMYISRLVDGISEIPAIAPEIRQEAHELYDKIGHQEFVKKFGNDRIIDKQKLLRRAEVFLQTGRDIEYFQAQDKQKILKNFRAIHLNLNPPREIIYQNCNQRFEQMLENRALEEVRDFIKNHQDFHNLPIAKTLGFEEIVNFLLKNIDRDDMIKLSTQKTRNYAKRQLTWFRHQFDQIEFCQNSEQIEKFTRNFLQNL